jgi:hypothetical protein
MYWACFNTTTGVAAIIYSANDPQETDETWSETYPYETEEEAQEALDRDA